MLMLMTLHLLMLILVAAGTHSCTHTMDTATFTVRVAVGTHLLTYFMSVAAYFHAHTRVAAGIHSCTPTSTVIV